MIYTHLAVALASAALAFAGGWQVRAWKAGRDDLVQLQAQQSDAARLARHVDAAAKSHEVSRASIRAQERAIVKEIERVVQTPVYRAECIDADGLRLIARAVDPAASAGQPAAAVPQPDPAH